jgi:MFS family permease
LASSAVARDALLRPVLSLFTGIAILVVGIGLLFTALGLRAGLMDFPVTVTGLVMSAYFAGFIVGTYVCPAIIRRAGHIRAFAAMASVASTMPILHALVVTPWAWGALRLLTGACVVGLYMVIESWLNALAPNSGRGKIFAAYMATTLGALALGQFLILVGDVLGFTPFALVSILLSLALVPVALTRVAEPPPVAAPRPALRRLLAVAPVGFVGAVASGLLNGAFFGMGAVFAQRVGMDKAGVAAFMSATIIGGALLQWPIGQLSDRRDRRLVLAAVCASAALLAALAFFAERFSGPLLLTVAFFYGGLAFTVYGISVAHVNDLLEPARVLEATGTLLLLHGIGAVIGPSAAGFLMQQLGPGSLLVFFALVLAAAGGYALYRYKLVARRPVGEPVGYMPMADSSQALLQLDPRTETESVPPSRRR